MGDVEKGADGGLWLVWGKKVADFRERDRSLNIPEEASKPSGEGGLDNHHRSQFVHTASMHTAHSLSPLPLQGPCRLQVAAHKDQEELRPTGVEKGKEATSKESPRRNR